MANVYYDSLIDEDKAKINAIVSSAKEHLDSDLDLVMALLERLNDLKKEIREEYKQKEKDIEEEQKKEKSEIAKRYVQSLNEGDDITFIYGPANFQKKITLPLEKKGAATIQVTFTPELLGANSKTAKRNIKYDKIVIPENFR